MPPPFPPLPPPAGELCRCPRSKRQVPILTEETAEQLPNQCLVRYRGMVRQAAACPLAAYPA